MGTDAGRDAGLDAGIEAGRDAGPPCMVGGECDPFSRDPCGLSRSCISDQTSATRCVVEAWTPRAEGVSCDIDNACQEGLECRGILGAPLACVRQCRLGSIGECGASGRCGLQASPVDACLGLCMPVGDCDVYLQDCGAGRACVLLGDPESDVDEVVACTREGTVPVGGACRYANDCVRGAGCIGGECLEFCQSTADCTAGACIGRTVSSVRYCL